MSFKHESYQHQFPVKWVDATDVILPQVVWSSDLTSPPQTKVWKSCWTPRIRWASCTSAAPLLSLGDVPSLNIWTLAGLQRNQERAFLQRLRLSQSESPQSSDGVRCGYGSSQWQALFVKDANSAPFLLWWCRSGGGWTSSRWRRSSRRSWKGWSRSTGCWACVSIRWTCGTFLNYNIKAAFCFWDVPPFADIGACESIMKKKTKQDFQELLKTEHCEDPPHCLST